MSRSVRALACGLALAACSPEPEPPRPNIVLVSIDSLRHDHLGCYGYARDTSPTIDGLAREGVRFENAVSTTSWTLPAHAAMFTGLYDSSHGLFDNGLRLAPEHSTLAEALKERGYHTAGFFGGPYLHPTFGLGDGFDVYRSCMTAIPDELTDEQMRRESRSPAGRSHRDVTGTRTIEQVTAWADERPAERPYFLFVHLWDVHYDFLPPPPYDRMFDAEYAGTIDGADFMGDPAIHPKMALRDLEHVIALYDGEIRWTDECLSRILDALRARGMLEDTLVVVTADHGEEFFEHGAKGHQKTLFDEVVRVPLVMRWPGRIPAGRVVEDQVRLIDLMPTFLRRAGARELPPMQGRDVWPLVDGKELPPLAALLELHADGQEQRALRTNALKAYAPGEVRGKTYEDMAYDLRADPRERARLPRRGDPRVEKAFAELESTLAGALALRDFLGARARSIEIDPEARRRLEEIGYIDVDDGK